ncbi:hypothetical protein ACZ90_31760 [Streptomyces albus subsp. albus]|nr:hypothetical protein ACZ90_31760 [Streptomyces albus subsp. albus]
MDFTAGPPRGGRLAALAATAGIALALTAATTQQAAAYPAPDTGAACTAFASGASAAAQRAVEAACAQRGVWYSWGGGHGATPGATYGYYDGQTPESRNDGERKGFDCSGLMRFAYYSATGEDILNATSNGQFHSSHASARFSAAQGTAPLLPGDLMFWGEGRIHHVAMYLGDGKMVEAQQSGTKVGVSRVRTGGDYAGAIRVAGAPGTPPTPPSDPGDDGDPGDSGGSGGSGGKAVMTWGSDVRTRTAPHTGADVVNHFTGPTRITIACQKHAQRITADGYTNDAWSQLSDGSWITNIYLQGPAWLPGVPDCGGSAPGGGSGSGGKAFKTWGSDVRTRTAPHTGADVVNHFTGPTRITVTCQKHAQRITADGYTNDAWSQLSDGSWITNIYLQGPAWLDGVPTCS